jgi:squalene-hopene/tetraprenyl-beta-curcumene cyclase
MQWVLAGLVGCVAAAPGLAGDVAAPGKNRPDEPRAAFSAARAADFLDRAAVTWTRERKCATCHTNVPYLMARPALREGGTAGQQEVRAFFEGRVTAWDKGARPRSAAEVVAVAAALALNDARTTGRLHPRTRAALDRMWTLQRPGGAWDWDKCTWPPLEHDDYYGATLAAVAAGHAPDGYAATPAARAGLARLRKYFRNTPPPNLHHRAWLTWAATRLDDLQTPAQREETVRELRRRQHGDGGWSLPSLGDWQGFDGRVNNTAAGSDGYATGLAVFVMRQAGVAADDPAVRRGASWLRANQRASGRWFTPSLNTDRAHYITNAGTAFAMLALDAVGAR